MYPGTYHHCCCCCRGRLAFFLSLCQTHGRGKFRQKGEKREVGKSLRTTTIKGESHDCAAAAAAPLFVVAVVVSLPWDPRHGPVPRLLPEAEKSVHFGSLMSDF